MKRRSFLGFLLAAPVAVKAIAAEAAQPAAVAKPSRAAGAAGTLRSADGSFVIDFDRGMIVMRGDMIADGAITAEKLSVGTLSAISAELPSATPWS
jgi:hypothetical protein